jgi:two-component system, LuxR family, response regulator FixJ
MAERKPFVIVVDDDRSVREAVGSLLDAAGYPHVVCDGWESFLGARAAAGPQAVLLLDIRIGERSGLALYREMAEAGEAPPLVLMTAYADVKVAIEAMRAGAADLLEKPFDRAALFAAIARADRGARTRVRVLSETAAREAEAGYVSLSGREAQVFHAMAQGLTSKAIARQLGISPRTVEVHRTHVFRKMGAATLSDIVRMAMAVGPGARAAAAPREEGGQDDPPG